MHQVLLMNGLFTAEISIFISRIEHKTTTNVTSFTNSQDWCDVNGNDKLILTSVTAQHGSNQNQIFKMDSSRFGRSKEESINQVVLEDPLQLFQLLLGMSRTILRIKICQDRTQIFSHFLKNFRIISAIHRWYWFIEIHFISKSYIKNVK